MADHHPDSITFGATSSGDILFAEKSGMSPLGTPFYRLYRLTGSSSRIPISGDGTLGGIKSQAQGILREDQKLSMQREQRKLIEQNAKYQLDQQRVQYVQDQFDSLSAVTASDIGRLLRDLIVGVFILLLACAGIAIRYPSILHQLHLK